MYSINGVALANPALGWELMSPSVPLSSLQQRITRSESAGRDGVTVAPPTRGPVSLKFTVRSPKANLGSLLALFSAATLMVRELADTSRTAEGHLVSSTVEQHFPKANFYTHSFLVEIPEGAWRGPQVTTALTAAAALGAPLSLFTGLSAPVQDALVRVRGPIQDPQVVDTSGAFFALDGTIAAGNYVRFDSNTGRAWLTTSDTWSGGSEVSGLIDFGGPRDVFEITPRFPTPSNPATREGRLTLTQGSFNTGAGFQVRGRPAFLL